MMLLAMLLQAAASPPVPAPAAPPPPEPVSETLKATDPAAAINAFKALCWASLREAEAFHVAVATAPLGLTGAPRPADAKQPGELYRSPQAALTYVASDTLPANIPPRQCLLRVRLAGAADQLALAARIVVALALPNGATRTTPAGAITSWDVAQPDGRTQRLIAATRNGTGGGTELRLSALLLAAK